MTTEAQVKARSVHDLIEQRLGVEVDFRFGEIDTVGTTVSIAARNDPGRAAILMVNLSTNTITVRPINLATTAQGIVLGQGGGAVSMNWQDDLIIPTFQWSAIADGASSNFFVLEAIIR